jgi:hypothetical protein
MSKSIHFELKQEYDPKFPLVRVYLMKDGNYYQHDEDDAGSLLVLVEKTPLLVLPTALWDALRFALIPETEEIKPLADSIWKARYEELQASKKEQVDLLSKLLSNNQTLIKTIINGRRESKTQQS